MVDGNELLKEVLVMSSHGKQAPQWVGRPAWLWLLTIEASLRHESPGSAGASFKAIISSLSLVLHTRTR